MVLAPILDIANNVGFSWETIVIIIALAAGFVFYSSSFSIGSLLHFTAFGLIFLWFYTAGYNYTTPLILMFIFLIIMCFSLYANSNIQRMAAGGVT